MARIGKYIVTGEIGRGAGSLVQAAQDPGIGRPVAIKVVSKQGIDAEWRGRVARLQRQAQAVGTLHHASIAAVYEYGEDGGSAWLAMELVQGKTLAEHLADGYRTGADSELVSELLDGLEHAHSLGVTHGDLRPENVLISQAGSVKLIGFEAVGDERADVAAAARLLQALIAEPPPSLESEHASIRSLAAALKGERAPRLAEGKLEALRRAMKAAPVAPAAAPRRLPAVLFVDDEVRVLNALRAAFEPVYEVHTATDAAAALALVQSRRFVVLVSDQRMPGMTGVELLREARRVAPSTVRLLLTGFSDFGAVMASVNESEVFRYLTKPWQQAELEATLAEAVDVGIAIEAAEAGGHQYARLVGSVLVVGEPALARSVRELSAGALGVQEAFDEETVLEIVSREDVGVVVAALDRRTEDPHALLQVLKRASPHTQLVALGNAGDSELAITLINEARIHRYLTRPVNLSLLQQAVASGLTRHGRLARMPALGGTERAARRGRSAGRLRALLERVRALGGRLLQR